LKIAEAEIQPKERFKMTMIITKNWFISQPREVRVAYLLRVMHSMTVDMRHAISSEQPDVSLRIAIKLNEMTHYLTSYGAAVLEKKQHLPNESLFDGLDAMLTDPDMEQYFGLTILDVLRFAASPPGEG
jgi:hypothetical protein